MSQRLANKLSTVGVNLPAVHLPVRRCIGYAMVCAAQNLRTALPSRAKPVNSWCRYALEPTRRNSRPPTAGMIARTDASRLRYVPHCWVRFRKSVNGTEKSLHGLHESMNGPSDMGCKSILGARGSPRSPATCEGVFLLAIGAPVASFECATTNKQNPDTVH